MSTSIAAHRHALHQIPETGWEVGKTAAYLRQVLEKLPCTVFSPVGEAVCAYFDFGRRETAAFRSDMDALPVTEQTGLPFRGTCTPAATMPTWPCFWALPRLWLPVRTCRATCC